MSDDPQEVGVEYLLLRGTRPEGTAAGIDEIVKIARCPDCDSEVCVGDIPPSGTIHVEVLHDDTCPWLNRRFDR